MKSINTNADLLNMVAAPLVRNLRHWLLRCYEDHCLISAEVETAKAREANKNVAYYQKRAALARAAQLD
jgi:hypothetical protein